MITQGHQSSMIRQSLLSIALLLLSWFVGGSKLAAQPTFSDQTAAVLPGVDFDSRSASLADIDDDGDLDLLFQRGGATFSSGTPRLFRNNLVGGGSLTFTDVSSMLGAGPTNGWSAAWSDYNGDGQVDVFMGQTNSGSNVGAVLTNRGAAGFTNDSVSTGLDDPGFHQNVAWNDIDNDRDLDLIIAMEGPFEKHEIYLQGPAGSFTPVGASVGFQQDYGTKAYGMAIGDTDGDGDLDVYITTCHVNLALRNNFYKNMLAETGSLSFADIADTNGTQNFLNGYGAEFHDFDDDGDLDLFSTGADGTPSKIYRNDGGNMFTDVDAIAGHPLLSDTGADLNGSRVLDYDNDGDLDLFFHDHLVGTGNKARKLYRNDGNWQFTDVTVAEGLHTANLGSYDSPWGDLDLDGDLDLVATTRGGTTSNPIPERVFLSNASTNGNHWLFVSLEGPSDNTTGIGATLYATINAGTPEERTLRREANTNAGTFNQSDLPVHFGLGAADSIDELAIHWRDGTIQVLHNVGVDQYITVRTPGDFNGDGQVDGEDLFDWQNDFGQAAASDADGDGDADGADFLWWQRQLGNGVRPSATAVNTAVPEPAASAIMALAAGLAIGARRAR